MSVTSRLAARRLTVRPGALGRRRSSRASCTRCRRWCSCSCSSSRRCCSWARCRRATGSCSAGDKGINFPTNYGALNNNPLFWPAVEFTIRYTVIVTVLLIGLGLGLALIVQETSRWVGMLRTVFLIPLAVGLAAASLLFWGFYSDTSGP